MGKEKKQSGNIYPFDVKKCPICNKPVKTRGWYCNSCVRKTNKLSAFLVERFNLKYPVEKAMVARMAEMYPNVPDIFEYIYDNPQSIFAYFALSKEKRRLLRESYKAKKNDNDTLSMDNTPKYILNYFKDREDLLLLNVFGKAADAKIQCRCLRCDKSFVVTWDNLRDSFHRCDSTISTGECMVMRFLQELGIRYKTQFDTLICRNPKTKHQLPYDFELVDRKVIIEVQGRQHLNFIKYFHTTEEAFEYQQFKDKVKRDYAIQKGYQFIELYYDDFKKDKYKRIILERLNYEAAN
ncbi:hypothetical protein SAMN02910301_0700 [Lachnospiraceae bacterium XBD2001]|nr:hypothetical protein SAMN02910301_0700 [Lachnospiraceae bacterium XBD2001]